MLRNILERRLIELQLMMFGVPSDEIHRLQDWEIMRDLELIKYLMEKKYNA